MSYSSYARIHDMLRRRHVAGRRDRFELVDEQPVAIDGIDGGAMRPDGLPRFRLEDNFDLILQIDGDRGICRHLFDGGFLGIARDGQEDFIVCRPFVLFKLPLQLETDHERQESLQENRNIVLHHVRKHSTTEYCQQNESQ